MLTALCTASRKYLCIICSQVSTLSYEMKDHFAFQHIKTIIEVVCPPWWDLKEQSIVKDELAWVYFILQSRTVNLSRKDSSAQIIISKLSIVKHLRVNLLKINSASNSLYLVLKFTLILASPPPAISSNCLVKQMGLAALPKSLQTWALFN